MRITLIQALSRGILIAAALVTVNVSAQVSNVEGIAPLEGVQTARPSGSLSESQREDKYWDDTKVVGNTEAFEAYINAYPKGRYVNLAKANLSQLKENASLASKKKGDAELCLKIFKSLLNEITNIKE